MKKVLVLLYILVFSPIIPFIAQVPVIGDWIVGGIVLGPIAMGLLWVLFVGMPNMTYVLGDYYSQSDLDKARRKGIQAGRNGGMY